jgi:hypothetical protein
LNSLLASITVAGTDNKFVCRSHGYGEGAKSFYIYVIFFFNSVVHTMLPCDLALDLGRWYLYGLVLVHACDLETGPSSFYLLICVILQVLGWVILQVICLTRSAQCLTHGWVIYFSIYLHFSTATLIPFGNIISSSFR